MTLRDFREKVNLSIYKHKSLSLSILSFLHVTVTLSSISLLIYHYGFPVSEERDKLIFKLIQYSFSFYILRYATRFFFDFHPLTFLKQNWFEGFLMLFLVVEGIAYNLFNTLLIEPFLMQYGFTSFTDFFVIFIQLFFLLILISQAFKKDQFKVWLTLNPAMLFVLSILALILIGTFLLMLPKMSNIEGGMSFVDALFFSTSSVSTTGLSTIDFANDVTFSGQIVVLALIKIGGLNTIAFGALLIILIRFGVAVKHNALVEDFIFKDSVLDVNTIFGKIVVWSVGIELMGTILFYLSFKSQGLFLNPADRFYHALFHSISGFNNAGISPLPGGFMYELVVDNYMAQLILALLIFLGGFGMLFLFDLFEIKRLRERLHKPWKTIEFGTKVSLYFTLILLAIGFLFIFIFEYNNTLKGIPLFGKIASSIFHSMTTRNAGFNSIDVAALSLPVLIIIMFLMFVGSSSGSAGGGIRTSTFAVLLASTVSIIRGKRHVELFQRTIPNDTVLKAYAIFIFFIAGNIIGPLVLSVSESHLLVNKQFDFLDLVFEHVSAAATVGLSTGVTPLLSDVGKYTIIFAMFVGRIGTLTVAYLISKPVISNNYKYPDGQTMIG